MQNLQAYNDAVAALTAKVAAQSTVIDGATALILGLKDEINSLIVRTDGIVDVSQLQNLASALDVGSKKLADAVAAGTSADAAAKAVLTPAPAAVDPAPGTPAGQASAPAPGTPAGAAPSTPDTPPAN